MVAVSARDLKGFCRRMFYLASVAFQWTFTLWFCFATLLNSVLCLNIIMSALKWLMSWALLIVVLLYLIVGWHDKRRNGWSAEKVQYPVPTHWEWADRTHRIQPDVCYTDRSFGACQRVSSACHQNNFYLDVVNDDYLGCVCACIRMIIPLW